LDHYLTYGAESFAEALSYFPGSFEFKDPDLYLEHLSEAKQAVDIPVIGSLNGISTGGWIDWAKKIEQTGVDALELNIYYIPTNPELSGVEVEQMYLNVLKDVKQNVKIPVAIKLGPFFSSMANMANRFCKAGADGLVLFNRFYQPDIDTEQLEVIPNLLLSTQQEMRLPMRWIAILYGQVPASLAATTGVHTAEDVIKMIMAGADVTMLCSALLKHGVGRISEIIKGLIQWMETNLAHSPPPLSAPTT
jgi:dihydroorotate dehydrogenase (fumarate)